jgi:hypothetical protein
MEARVQSIISEQGTKTAKIQKLILLGLTRTEIARLLTNGNYGFVQNVYACPAHAGARAADRGAVMRGAVPCYPPPRSARGGIFFAKTKIVFTFGAN